jgi:hypothetical protein
MGVSGGMDMSRNRQQNDQLNTYLGEDSQTSPIQDLGSYISQYLNQNRAQQNSLYGGNGYGGSYGGYQPSGYRPGGGGGAALPPGQGGGGQGFYGASSAPGPGAGPRYGNSTQPRGSTDQWGGQDQPQDPGYHVGFGDNTGFYAPDQGANSPSGGANGLNGLNVQDHRNYFTFDPKTGGYRGDPGYGEDAYFPRDPSRLNDEDNARPSPFAPQGNPNDPWNAKLTGQQGPPTGGLVGGYQQFGNATPYENQVGGNWMDMYRNPMGPQDYKAEQGLEWEQSGALTPLEQSTRDQAQASMSPSDRENTQWDQAQSLFSPTDRENQQWGVAADLSRGQAGATAEELANRAQYNDFIQGLGGAGGGGASIFGGTGGGSSTGGFSSGPAGGIGAGSAYQGAMGAFSGMVNGQGYSPAEQAALRNQQMDVARTTMDTAASEMARKRAMTGQQAGFYGAQAQLAGERAGALANANRQGTLDIANEAERRKEAGAQGLGGLAGIEASNANAEASRASAANALAAENARTGAQLRLAAMGQLGNLDEAARARQEAGMGGMNAWNQNQVGKQGLAFQQENALNEGARQRQQFGLGLQNQQDTRAAGRMGEGTAGLAQMGSNLYGRRAGANQGAQAWAQGQRQNRQFGLQGQQGLYNQGQAQLMSLLGQAFDIYRLPRETYTKGATTAGSGGIKGG